MNRVTNNTFNKPRIYIRDLKKDVTRNDIAKKFCVFGIFDSIQMNERFTIVEYRD